MAESEVPSQAKTTIESTNTVKGMRGVENAITEAIAKEIHSTEAKPAPTDGA